MTCAEARRLLDGYVDNELDLRSALEVEDHLSACPLCRAQEKRLRELSAFARANLTRHALPDGFEERLRSAWRAGETAGGLPASGFRLPATSAAQPRAAGRSRRTTFRAVAPALAAVVALAILAPRLWTRPSGDGVESAVFAAHVRSLLANHLTDVTSSDQHTVKPWFQGKLDYSVSAPDFAAAGFPLVGGRLDYIEDTPVAALVYKRNQHVVNHFVWVSSRGGDEPMRHLSRRGYGAHRWTKDGLSHWVVSDLNDAELQQFVRLVQGE